MVSCEGRSTGVKRTRPARTRPAERAKEKELEERENMTAKEENSEGEGAARTMKSDDEAEEEKKGTRRLR